MKEKANNRENCQEVGNFRNVMGGCFILVGSVFFFLLGIALLSILKDVNNYWSALLGCISFILFSLSFTSIFILDLLIGKKFDLLYKEKILSYFKYGGTAGKYPLPYYFSGLRIYRTMMYGRAILSKKLFRSKAIFGTDNLRRKCEKIDILLSYSTFVFIGTGFLFIILCVALP